MAAQQIDIRGWANKGIRNEQRWMIVVCDSYDYEDYPVYAKNENEFWRQYEEHNGKNMQRIMEVYDLSLDIESQLKEKRAFHMPPRKG
jgi:hypothetical protein